MMPSNDNSVVTKAVLQQRFNDKDLQCHYYEAIMNSTTDLIALSDGDRIIDANTAMIDFCESLGRDVFSETFGFADFFETVNKFDYIYDGYQGKRWYEWALEGKKEDYRVGIRQNGVIKTFNLTLVPLKPYDSIYVMTLTDVTNLMGYKATLEEGIKSSMKDREKTQFMLRQYDKAIDAATLVFKCDTEGIIIYANKALTKVFLYGYGELIGKHVSILRSPNVKEGEDDAVWEWLRRGKMYRGVMENIDKLGGLHYFDVTMVPISDQEGNIVEFLSLRHEITEVMEAKESAIKTLEEKSKFFDQVSHELRTPLNAIINFTDSALESFDEIFEDEETRNLVKMYIDRSYKNSQHLLHLINSLLDMAKLRSGKEKYDMVSLDAVSLVRDVYESTSALNTKEKIEYLIEVPAHPILIKADHLRLRQILTNLVSNALKFTEWGYVQIRVREMSKMCWIDVEDTGIGIPSDKLERIFEPFEQVGVHDQGTGLGLGIVNEYAKGMGMKLRVTSVLGGGSCFELQIPTEISTKSDR